MSLFGIIRLQHLVHMLSECTRSELWNNSCSFMNQKSIVSNKFCSIYSHDPILCVHFSIIKIKLGKYRIIYTRYEKISYPHRKPAWHKEERDGSRLRQSIPLGHNMNVNVLLYVRGTVVPTLVCWSITKWNVLSTYDWYISLFEFDKVFSASWKYNRI